MASLHKAKVEISVDILGDLRLMSFTFYHLLQKFFHSPSDVPQDFLDPSHSSVKII